MAKQKPQTEEQPTTDQADATYGKQANGRQPEEHDEEQVPRMSRQEAALKCVAAIRGETTLQELAEEAARLYHEGRGEDEPDEDSIERQVWIVKGVLDTAEGLGILETEETWIIKVRPKAR